MPIIHRENGVPPSKARIRFVGAAFNDTIASMASHTVTFTPPRGKKWQVLNMRIKKGAPAGGASGTHLFQIKQTYLSLIKGKSVFGSHLDWDSNCWVTADSEQLPATNEAALIALHAIKMDCDNPLVITYSNYTDVSNNATGEIYLHVLETPII